MAIAKANARRRDRVTQTPLRRAATCGVALLVEDTYSWRALSECWDLIGLPGSSGSS